MLSHIFKQSPLVARKCGPAVVPLAALSAVGGIAGAASTSANISSQLGAQKSENEKNRKWQSQEAVNSREFQTNERLAQQDWAKTMLDYTNQYNTPSAQMSRLNAAGINPAVYFGNGVASALGGSAPSSPSAPSTPMPTSVSGLSPVGGFQSIAEQFQLSSAGKLLESLANAKRATSEGTAIDKTLDAHIDKLIADTDNVKLQNAWQTMSNSIRSANLDQEQYSQLMRYMTDSLKFDITLADKVNAEGDAIIKSLLSGNRSSGAKDLLKSTNVDLAWQVKQWQMLYNTQLSEQASNYASAMASRSTSAMYDQLSRGYSIDNILKDSQVPEALVEKLKGLVEFENYKNHPTFNNFESWWKRGTSMVQDLTNAIPTKINIGYNRSSSNVRSNNTNSSTTNSSSTSHVHHHYEKDVRLRHRK